MSEVSAETGQQFVGVKKDQNGGLDFSSAPEVLTDEQVDKRVREQRFQQAIQDAEKVGLSEDRLRTLVTTFSLGDNDKPIHRRAILATEGKKVGAKSEDVLSLVRNYKKERVRVSENGDLYHYHQTSFDGFESASEMGGLMAYDKLKALGKIPEERGIGARPDVVQMTRDEYNGDGKLVRRGLVEGVQIGAISEVALVFDESAMDLPDYDNLGHYPNLTTIPFDRLKCVLVGGEEDKLHAQEILESHNLSVDVKTKDEWTASVYSKVV